MIDLERELAAAMQVEPAGDFAARVRARISREAPRSRWRMPMLALAAVGCAMVALLAGNLLPSRLGSTPRPDALAVSHQDLAAMTPLRAAAAAIPLERPVPPGRAAVAMSDVLVSRSEMLALQRLFAGDIVAPPAGAVSEELSIPQLAIDSILLPTILEGDQQ